MAMTNTQQETINRAIDVAAENVGRRMKAGQSLAEATRGAVAEFSERWPQLGATLADILAPYMTEGHRLLSDRLAEKLDGDPMVSWWDTAWHVPSDALIYVIKRGAVRATYTPGEVCAFYGIEP